MSDTPSDSYRYGQAGGLIFVTAIMLLELTFGAWLVLDMGSYALWQRALVGVVFLRSGAWWFGTIAKALP